MTRGVKTDAAFIGGPGVGKTCLADMLYRAAAVHAAGNELLQIHPLFTAEDLEPFRKFRFKVTADPKTLMRLRDIGSYLEVGEFPPPTPVDTLDLLTLNIVTPGFFGTRKSIGIYEVSGESITDILDFIRKHDLPEVNQKIMEDQILGALFNSKVFIFLIDSTACIPLPDDPGERMEVQRRKYETDMETAQIISMIAEYKMRVGGKIRAIAALLTKHDMVGYRLPLSNGREYKEALKSLSSTISTLEFIANEFGIDNIAFFKSGLKVEMINGSVKPAIPLRFYLPECLKLIKWLMEI